jgi:phosphoesterase RecJ-like protein
MKEVRLDGLKALLNTPKHIVVTNHVNPDGDAMGSALGLALSLKKLGHTVNVIVPNDYPDFLKWMPGTAEVLLADQNMPEAERLIAQCAIIFHLDYNAISRAEMLEKALTASTAKKVMIDHHRQPEEWPDFIYSDISMSSTSQMVFEFLEMNDWLSLLDVSIAECLYTGIITDTGSFRFAITTGRTHHVAAQLLNLGVSPNIIYDRVFDNNSMSRLRLMGSMLNHMEYYKDQNTALLYLKKAQLMKNNYQRGDSEGFVNYGLSIGGTVLSIFLREDKGIVKISLRSKGQFDVNDLARKHFNGGGHVNAAGGSLTMTMDDALAYTRDLILQLKNVHP